MLKTAIRGYFAALATGNIVFWVSGLIRTLVFGPHDDNEVGIAGFMIVFVLIFVASLSLTILPFLLFCTVYMVLHLRNFAYFVLCGVALGLLIAGVVIGAGWADWRMWVRNASLWQQLSLSGAAGGLVYWQIVVRRRVAQLSA